MSRPLRIEYEGAWYHVMHRGAGRRQIFHTDKDRELFFKLLSEAHLKFKIEIHAYCLMSNHYHLLIKTQLANLQQAMRHINGIYALRYNNDKKTDGPLFRGRYKAIVVDAENYLLRLSRYIHMNPLVAKLCKKPEYYKWSSYQYYIGNKKRPDWLYVDETFSFFDNENQSKEYYLFMKEKIDVELNNFYQKSKKIPILGAEEFISQLSIKYFKDRKIHREVSERKMIENLYIPTISKVIEAVSNYYSVESVSLKKSKKGVSNKPRLIAMYMASIVCQQTLVAIANEFLGISYGGVSNNCRKMSRDLLNDKQMRDEVRELMDLLHCET